MVGTAEVDVLIIGAGFAGLTAARELAAQGRTVRLVDARDRIGGRTWCAEGLGRTLELGGTWVHWTQPHVWAEMRRYGIGVVPSPEPVRAWWPEGGRIIEGEPATLLERLDAPNRALLAESRALFPRPFDPLGGHAPLAAIDQADTRTVGEAIALLDLDQDARTLLETFWSLNFNGSIHDGAYTQALRWVALTSGDWAVNFEACASYKIDGGTAALAEAILADADVELQLETRVDALAIEGDGPAATVRATTADGGAITARRAIVTLPLHALRHVRFEPELPAGVRAGIAQGQAGLGTKVWFRLVGVTEPFVAFGESDWPLNFLQGEYPDGDGIVVIGFGPDASALESSDLGAVQDAVRRILPDAVVEAIAGHDWTADSLSGETWPMHRPGFLTESLAAFQEGAGPIRFAGADVADGWGGFIDGAIESGLAAAARVRTELEEAGR